MWRAGLLGVGLLAAAVGCGPEKELPTVLPSATDRDKAAADPVPTTSDPAAKAFVDACIRTATDGHPERLDKARAFTARMSGLIRANNQNNPSSRELKAVWPDRLRVDQDLPVGDVKRLLFGLRRDTVWLVRTTAAGAEDATPDDQAERAAYVRADAVAEFWLATLVPLADPRTVLFDARSQELLPNQPPVDTVKAAVPGCPVYTLWFDPGTKLLGLVTYTHRELTVTYKKQVRLADHAPRNGVQLPTKTAYARNAVTLGEWTVAEWEFVGSIDEAAFDPPAADKK